MKRAMTKREGKEEILKSFVESSREVVHGLSNESLAASRDLMHKMVRYGRITEDQATRLEKRLVERMQQSREIFETKVAAIAEGVVDRLKSITEDELKALEKRLNRLDARTHKPVAQPRSRQLQ